MSAHITGADFQAMEEEEAQRWGVQLLTFIALLSSDRSWCMCMLIVDDVDYSLHVNVNNLTFAYPNNPKPVLKDLNVQLAPGARCLLVGANGSGKSTLLRVLAGRHLTKPEGACSVLGRDAFHDTRLNVRATLLHMQHQCCERTLTLSNQPPLCFLSSIVWACLLGHRLGNADRFVCLLTLI